MINPPTIDRVICYGLGALIADGIYWFSGLGMSTMMLVEPDAEAVKDWTKNQTR